MGSPPPVHTRGPSRGFIRAESLRERPVGDPDPAEGSAWCWGRGTEGQLGTKRKNSSARPMRVQLPCPD
ncbi:RCC1 domain-containing protein [Corallococcus sp. AB038B]|uniref:RCC1-like domain-containing protein n=1 Tax=Corallococcus sp. AB038B TaxID=2316718 RepID=UPI000EE63732|nr:hypothetical protein [Corallococcus exiguus]RKI02077.1 hypothetical protein D7Y04_14580 [Corallococcus sp. AB038B]